MITRPFAAGLGVLVLGMVAACVTLAPDERRVASGTWGGEHVGLAVTDAGAHVEFDCASGDIAQPLALDGMGNLSVDGVYVREHGGPIQVGEVPDRKPARYTGRAAGTTLTLDVLLTDSNEKIGTFTLERGAASGVRKCL
jgi:hypothetical protein